jgi:preprotein translocase subunit SecE
MNKIVEYLKGVRNEMGKVAWPTKDEVKSATYLVIIVSLVFGGVIKVFDLALNKILGFILNL